MSTLTVRKKRRVSRREERLEHICGGETSLEKKERIAKVLRRQAKTSAQCALCHEAIAVFQIERHTAFGYPSSFVCHQCHEVILEIEEAIRQIRCAALKKKLNLKEIRSATEVFRKHKSMASIRHFTEAIDALRNHTRHKSRLNPFKHQLAELMIDRYQYWPTYHIGSDRRCGYAKISFVLDDGKWSCHLRRSAHDSTLSSN